MKKFLAIYPGSASDMSAWNTMDVATRKTKEQAGLEDLGVGERFVHDRPRNAIRENEADFR